MVMKVPALWFTVISRPSNETIFLIAALIKCSSGRWLSSPKSRLNSSKHPTTPNKINEDATHRLEVNALAAIEDEDLPIEARP